MDARDAAARQVGGDDAITTRMGAMALPIGVVLIAISEVFHPSRQDPMDFPAVFKEYASSNVWTTVHFGEYFGFLFLLGGLVAGAEEAKAIDQLDLLERQAADQPAVIELCRR